MAFINIVGGIFLILFGLRYLRKGFARVLGGDLLEWLQRFTRTRAKSFFGGMIAGTVMPSSTAMAFLSVEMSRDGKTAWPNVLAVLLGAQVGITVLVQVLTFNLNDYAGLFLVVGGLLFLFLEAQKPRGFGQVILSFAFLLLGMGLISSAAREVGGDPAIINLFAALGELPLLLLAGAMILTIAIQSSTASIAVALGLAASGQVTLPMLLLWVIGTNLGLCATVLIAGWSRVEGRRLGLSVILIKGPLGIAATLGLLAWGSTLLEDLPGSLNQQAAWSHTLFNLLGGIGILFAERIRSLTVVWIPQDGSKLESTEPSRLDLFLLQHPALAVKAGLRETLRIFDTLHIMRESILDSVRKKALSPHFEEDIRRRADSILQLRGELVDFFDSISDDDIDEEDRKLKDAIDDLMREMPVMVRTFERDMLAETRSLVDDHSGQIDGAMPILEEASRRCGLQMENVARMLMQENPSLGQEILARKQENSSWMIAAKRRHGSIADPAWEMIDDFQQLNRRLSSVAYVYCSDLPLAEQL